MYQVLQRQGPVLDKALNITDKALCDEAPVVSAVVPSQQRVGEMDNLMNKRAKLRLRQVPFEQTQRLDKRSFHLPPYAQGRLRVVRVVVADYIKELVQRRSHGHQGSADTYRTDTREHIRDAAAQESYPRGAFGLFSPRERTKGDLIMQRHMVYILTNQKANSVTHSQIKSA